ncbi:hypothetical protein LCGC14_2648220, partial [marine sediment metagenome]
EVNGPDGVSISVGEWIQLHTGWWKLRLRPDAFLVVGDLFCCFLREYDSRHCTNDADWEIQGPKGFEDNTHVCTEHLTEMLDPTEAYTITPIAGA